MTEQKQRRLLDADSATRKTFPMASGLLDYFPDALAYVAWVSHQGNEKHNPGEPLHHARGKSMDHADCIVRHLARRGEFDGEVRESGALAWRALALLQEELEQAYGFPLPRGARPAQMFAPGEAVEVKPRPGERFPAAVNRTFKEIAAATAARAAHNADPSTHRQLTDAEKAALANVAGYVDIIKFGFELGETVNVAYARKGNNPGVVVGFNEREVLVRWQSWGDTHLAPQGWAPSELRHGA